MSAVEYIAARPSQRRPAVPPLFPGEPPKATLARHTRNTRIVEEYDRLADGFVGRRLAQIRTGLVALFPCGPAHELSTRVWPDPPAVIHIDLAPRTAAAVGARSRSL